MKATGLLLFYLFCYVSALAQKPVSATLTQPKSPTIIVGKPKIPPLKLPPCRMKNGELRPYPCEFALLKLVFYDNAGNIIGQVTGSEPGVTLPLSKAKSKPTNGAKGLVTYNVRAVMIRTNPPSFQPKAGYMIRSAYVTVALQSDPLTTHVTGVSIPAKGKIEIPFTASWLYEKSEGVTVGPREFYIENDVTTTKFPFNSAVFMRDKAEASLVVQPKINSAL